MSRQKQDKFVEVIAKTERGKQRLSYHTNKWRFKQEVQELKFVRSPGPYVGVMSRDGQSFLWIRKENDPDFAVRYMF